MKVLIIVLLIICIGFADNLSDNPDLNPKYSNGQVLLPDYACQDTLIVFDADGLNKAMENLKDYSDSGIDSTFHLYAK